MLYTLEDFRNGNIPFCEKKGKWQLHACVTAKIKTIGKVRNFPVYDSEEMPYKKALAIARNKQKRVSIERAIENPSPDGFIYRADCSEKKLLTPELSGFCSVDFEKIN